MCVLLTCYKSMQNSVWLDCPKCPWIVMSLQYLWKQYSYWKKRQSPSLTRQFMGELPLLYWICVSKIAICNHFYYTIVNTNGILLPKLFWPTVRKNCSTDREKLLKFDAEGWEFAKIVRSLKQFIQAVKGQNNFW